MKELWHRIAKFFTEWNGDEKSTLTLSVNELRYINNMHVELINLRKEKEYRNTPKKVIKTDNCSQACPVCERPVNQIYCGHCGQKLTYNNL